MTASPHRLRPRRSGGSRLIFATLDAEAIARRREGRARAEAQFLPLAGCFTTERAMQVVQIDHTKVDVTVVDPIERQPIGRPILTIGVDVFTRMVVGFYLSLEAPSVTSVALCLTHAVVDKSAWLAERGIGAEWPTCGAPECIHVDNGAEFHARAFTRGCADHGIEISYRPPATPRFGGHIERLIGSMMGSVHLLPGTHFSNVAEKGDYDPEARAVMTMRELETFLALEIVGCYHASLHRGLNRPPIAAWREAVAAHRPRGVCDPVAFLLDFLPFETRVLRRTGVHLHNICYWSDGFAPWIGRSDEKVIVKYDPRDLRRVFVRLGASYVTAPTRNLARPGVTLWELRAALRALRARGRREVDEELIFQTIAAQRALIDGAARETAEAHRLRARRADLADRPAAAAAASAPIRMIRNRSSPPVLPRRGMATSDDPHLDPRREVLPGLTGVCTHRTDPRRSLDRLPSRAKCSRGWTQSSFIPKRARMPNLSGSSGDSGMGKTMMIEKFARSDPRKVSTCGERRASKAG